MITNELSSVVEGNLAVVGGVGGDEGKGKIVSALAALFQAVVRFSGGSNAGHTTYTEDGQKLVGHLIPSGLAAGVPCVLARGVLFDAHRFVAELNEALSVINSKPPPILIDRGCALWTPYHSLIETWCEDMRGGDKIGTTGRGIGPLAAIRDLRVGLQVEDLALPYEELKSKVDLLYQTFAPILRELHLRRSRMEEKYHVNVPGVEEVVSQLAAVANYVLPHMADTRPYLYDIHRQGGKLLFEGAQAMMLDLSWGTYPFVSSTMSTALGVAQGTGLPLLPDVCLVTKVMPTRVGRGGPMPSEFWDRAEAEEFPTRHPELFKDGEARNQALTHLLGLINSGKARGQDYACYFQILGYEQGASTGRGRSVGALDLQSLAYAIQVNAPKFLALTRFDMLSGLKQVPVVTCHLLNGQPVPAGLMPTTRELERVQPVVEEWPCWDKDITGCRQESQLPYAARQFLRRVETSLGVPIRLVGTGPGHHDLIVR